MILKYIIKIIILNIILKSMKFLFQIIAIFLCVLYFLIIYIIIVVYITYIFLVIYKNDCVNIIQNFSDLVYNFVKAFN